MQPPNEKVVFEPEENDERVVFNQAEAGKAPSLKSPERESKLVDKWTYSHAQAAKMAKHIHACFLQTYSLNAGLKEFGQEGYDAAYKEIGQLHGRGGLTPTGLRDLTDEAAKRALEAVTILLRKKSGLVKSRTCANGSVQCNWMTKEEVTSPTALTESVLLTGLYRLPLLLLYYSRNNKAKIHSNSISIELNEMRGRGCRGAPAEVQEGPMTCWSVCLLQSTDLATQLGSHLPVHLPSSVDSLCWIEGQTQMSRTNKSPLLGCY